MKSLIISITLSLLLSLFAYHKKAMTNSALILAFIFSCLITYFGGISSFLILTTVFIGSSFGSKLKHQKKEDTITLKNGKKDIYQIFANVGLAALIIVIYGITNKFVFLLAYACIMAESLADTLASDIGFLSSKLPINIITFQKSTPGLSGNISFLGLISSLLGSLIISLIFIAFHFNIIYLVIILESSFLGAIFDSLLGATIQVKYKCPKCQLITEKKEHCQTETNYYQGLSFINNDMVNFLSNVFAGILGLILAFYLI